jgi:hypothetical protein
MVKDRRLGPCYSAAIKPVAQVRDAMEKAQTAIARRAKGLREFEEK